MKKITLLIFIALLLTSCTTLKLIKSGTVEEKEYSVEIPFEYRLGLIVLKVNISGEECDFILDTGAPNVISEKLAKKLKLNSLVENKLSDSQDKTKKIEFTLIEKLGIGNIHFLNTAAAIVDLELSNEISCMKVDGIIGANLMRKAVWKIDYQNQLITITDSMESLNIPESASKVPFFLQKLQELQL